MSESPNSSKRFSGVTEDDRELICKLWHTHSMDDIARIVGFSGTTVRKWARRMGLNRATSRYKPRLKNKNPYTEFEIRYIRDNVNKKTSYEIAKALGRSRNGVMNYCKRFKIRFTNSHKLILQKLPIADIEWIKKNYAYCSNSFICMKLGISDSTLYRIKTSLNLKKSKEYMSDMCSRRNCKSYQTAKRNGNVDTSGKIPKNFQARIDAMRKAKREREAKR